MTLVYIVAAAILVMLASLSGKLVTWRLIGPYIERNLAFLVSFAAGVLLVVVYGLMQEVTEHAGSATLGLPWIVAGAILILVMFRYVPDFHHHHDESREDHSHDTIGANRVLASDALHNGTDGILLAASFSVSPLLGVLTSLSIFLHECVQEISEFFVLRHAGLSTARALAYNFLSSSTILIGALGGYFLMEQFEAIELPLLGLAAGSYLMVVFHDLIPHSIRSSKTRIEYAKHFAWFAIGLALMALLSIYVTHEEPDDVHDTSIAAVE